MKLQTYALNKSTDEIMDFSDNSHSQQHLANQRTFLAWQGPVLLSLA